MMMGSRGWLAGRRGAVVGLSEGLIGYTSDLYVGGLGWFKCFKGVVFIVTHFAILDAPIYDPRIRESTRELERDYTYRVSE